MLKVLGYDSLTHPGVTCLNMLRKTHNFALLKRNFIKKVFTLIKFRRIVAINLCRKHCLVWITFHQMLFIVIWCYIYEKLYILQVSTDTTSVAFSLSLLLIKDQLHTSFVIFDKISGFTYMFEDTKQQWNIYSVC